MTTLTATRSTVSFARVAGILTVIGAVTGVIGAMVLLFAPPTASIDVFNYPFEPSSFALIQTGFFLNHLLLGTGLLALAASTAVRARPGRTGVWLAVAGMALLTVAELLAIAYVGTPYPSSAAWPIDTAYGVSTILLGVGLVLAGVGVLRAREWTGWRRWIVLILGATVFLVVTPGLMLGFVGGRVALAVWMVAWGLFGVALLSESRSVAAGRR